jgi:ADP-L-glycero-D-manno-heptose 6-epimerase
MASMVFHGYNQIIQTREIKLFKSYNPDYKDGWQLRDFIYVKDICSSIIWLLNNGQVNGLFNLGTGCSQSFFELAEALFHSLNLEINITYIDMPEHLKSKYQYYTKANISKLRDSGFKNNFMDLESGVRDYVNEYLNKNFLSY